MFFWIQCLKMTRIFDLYSILKGILFAKADTIKTVTDMIRLYVHESERVYCDRLVDNVDIEIFYKAQKDVLKKSIEVSFSFCFFICFFKWFRRQLWWEYAIKKIESFMEEKVMWNVLMFKDKKILKDKNFVVKFVSRHDLSNLYGF